MTVAEEALAARLERLQRRGQTNEPRRGRRHPARAARYSAAGMSALSLVGLTSLFISESKADARPQLASQAVVTTEPTTEPTAAAGAPTAQTSISGSTFSNRWGDVQVQATFASDGRLLSVTALQTPYSEGKSVRINSYAVPILTSEAVAAQSADIHTVSGATYTSIGYSQSLQSAIDTARAAHLTTLS